MSTPNTAIAIRHVEFEHLGTFAPALAARDYDVRLLDAGCDDLTGIATPDLLVILGGPIGAYEEARYPFLTEELRLIERQLGAGKPLLGICLGAQLIARALGAPVYPGKAKEIGWAALTPTLQGERSALGPLADIAWRVLHWHGDTFDLPAGATRLASTEITPNQAFAYGTNVLGLQFHMEVDAAQIERWLIGHAVEIAATGVSIEGLRSDTARWGQALGISGAACLLRWLDGINS